MKNNNKRNKKIILFAILLTFCLMRQNVFAESIWFATGKPGRNSDGSIYAELQICSDDELLDRTYSQLLVYGNEASSKWNKNYHKGSFMLNRIDKGQGKPFYIVNSRHSIMYEIKAICNNVLSDGERTVSCANINLHLSGKRRFDPLDNENDVIESKEFKFPFEIKDKNVSVNYWIQTGQELDLLLLFNGQPLPNKKLSVFNNKGICGEYFTDDKGNSKFKVPFTEHNSFKHTRDVCHYRIEAEHEQDNILYNTTLTLLVHPKRRNSNFIVGLYTLLCSFACGLAFVVFKRKRFKVK